MAAIAAEAGVPASTDLAAAHDASRRSRDRRAARTDARRAAAGLSPMQEMTKPCRAVLTLLGLFSAIVNVLMLTGPLYMLQVYDRVLSSGHIETLAMLSVAAVGALAFLGLFDALRATVATRMGAWFSERLGPICLAAEMRRAAVQSGATPRSLSDLGQIQGFLASHNLSAFFDAPWAPFFIALVWLLHPWLGMVAIAAAVLLFILSLVNERATRSDVAAASRAQTDAKRIAEEMTRSAREVRALGMDRPLIQRWSGSYLDAVANARAAGERSGWIVAFSKFVRLIVQIAILGVGAVLVLRGEITAGAMVAGSILLGRALAPVEQAMGAWRAFVQARVAYGRVGQLLEAFPEPPPRTQMPRPRGELRVDRLSAADPGGQRLLLNNVSFAIGPGEALAILGPSGAGKSTLCRLLVGGEGRKAGDIRLDGARIDAWDPGQLGASIGYMPQNVGLFSGTVAENIARYRRAWDEDIVSAARAARVHEMVAALPEGYETLVGPGGITLSGGQQQRIALARALFGAPPLVVLDEPNANLDSEGEAALGGVISDLKDSGVAVVIVGHRPSTIEHVDDILVMVGGAVADYGPRDNVLARMRGAVDARANAQAGARTSARPQSPTARAAPAARPAEPEGGDAAPDPAAPDDARSTSGPRRHTGRRPRALPPRDAATGRFVKVRPNGAAPPRGGGAPTIRGDAP